MNDAIEPVSPVDRGPDINVNFGDSTPTFVDKAQLPHPIALKRIVEVLANRLNLQTYQATKALEYALKCIVLLDQKQQDYGTGNIDRHGLLGVLVRMDDKSARMANLINAPKDSAPNFESLSDTGMDFTNYGLIMQMLIDNTWKQIP